MKKPFDWLESCTYPEYEWLAVARLAKERGFEYPRARRQEDGSYVFMSGLTYEQLCGLRDEIRAGGWGHLQTTRKRHYFKKPGQLFNNPSLCGKHDLGFYTFLDHDFQDESKCAVCLRKYKRLEIEQILKE